MLVRGYQYAKTGFMLGDFYQSGIAQFDMFSKPQPRANTDALMAALDTINRSAKGRCGLWIRENAIVLGR